MRKSKGVCKYCGSKFENQTLLSGHYKSDHPEQKPFECDSCGICYPLLGSLQRHIKQCHSKGVNIVSVPPTIVPVEVEPRSTLEAEQPPVKKRRVESLEENGTESNRSKSFVEWYEKVLSSTNSGNSTISQNTFDRSLAFYKAAHLPFDSDMCDVLAFEDIVDDYIDSSSVEASTVVLHLRYVRVITQWKIEAGEYTKLHLQVVDEKIKHLQNFASRKDHHVKLLNFLCPEKLIHIRDLVVTSLRKIQFEIIDPVLVHVLRSGDFSKVDLKFSKTLRNWLELSLRFISIPLRIQCTQYLVFESVNDQTTLNCDYGVVCRLVKLPSGYCRVVCRDKVQSRHTPVHINVPVGLNPYLHFYIRHASTKFGQNAHNLVFTNSKGGVWVNASKQLKKFIRLHAQVDPDDLDPSGRFIHCTRKIAMAVYAVAVNYDTEKLKGFSKLLRNSLDTNEKYYCQWLDSRLAQKSISEWDEKVLGVLPSTPEPVVLHSIRNPHSLIHIWFEKDYKFGTGGGGGYFMVNKSTQTESDEVSAGVNSNTQKKCENCGEPFLIMGPLGNSRHSKFGCYFTQCRKCDGLRPTPRTVWFELGFTPEGKSVSSKPRNLGVIRKKLDEVEM